MTVNLEAHGRPVTIITVTPPGVDRLPWDRARCMHSARAKCSGKRYGCKVQDRALREWADTVTLRWGWLRRAARQAVKHSGIDPPRILERVWEPQKRGPAHIHLVVSFGTVRERWAAQRFAEELDRLGPSYDFGFTDTHLEARTGAMAARYLASYLTGRSAKKNSIRANIADPRLPRSLVWLTPDLTRRTFVTMRRLRAAAQVWGWSKGMCPSPRWRLWEERERVVRVLALVYGVTLPRPPPMLPGLADHMLAAEYPAAWVPTPLRSRHDDWIGAAAFA